MDTPVRIPICPAEHFFLTYRAIADLEGKRLPSVRDYDSQVSCPWNAIATKQVSIFYILSPCASAEYEILMKRKNEKKEKKEGRKQKLKYFF